MGKNISSHDISDLVARWLPDHTKPPRIFTDTTEFFQLQYGDVIIMQETPYLIRQNAKEGRLGLDEEVKYWVKRAIDLYTHQRKIIKLEFHEKFNSTIGGLSFECFRSPRKEARILELTAEHPDFMHGVSILDDKKNIVRIIDFISGPTIGSLVENVPDDHETYFYEQFPEILTNFMECIKAIGFLHENYEKHGDIRRDHIIIDRGTGRYRWIDFDYNYRHRENIYGYDLFGLGNILIFLAGRGDVMLPVLKDRNPGLLNRLTKEDLNIGFGNRVANLKKAFPYLPESLNRILLHFSKGSNWFYENTSQLLGDLEEFRSRSNLRADTGA